MSVRVDGIERPDKVIVLVDDHKDHIVMVRIPGSKTVQALINMEV